MSKPKQLGSYPPILQELAQRFESGQRSLALRERDKATLENLRFAFYAFRKALHRSGADKLYPNIDAIAARITSLGGIYTLEFYHVDHDSLYAPLREALENAEREAAAVAARLPTPAPTPAEPAPLTQPHHEDAIAAWFTRGKTENTDDNTPR